MRISRGDIVIVDLDPTRGSDQHRTRPCLVVQNDVGNRNVSTTIVVAFTTAFDDRRYPFEVLVRSDECGLRDNSIAVCSLIRTISIEDRITENLGSVTASTMAEVDDALEFSLGLRPV